MVQCTYTMFVSEKLLNIFIVFFLHTIIGVRPDDGPEVVTGVGMIRGVKANDGNYSMFMGIPFAKVNESNPFGASLPFPNFDTVFEANDGSIACPQIEEFNETLYGTLDCLTLNIYVPDSASLQTPLPVMVYIFGGAFRFGLATDFFLGPKFLVRHDVIFVTINYRLGLYGFMCLHTPEVPGNQGFRDQYDGMTWVKNHISAFGGDPDRITLFGNSAGALSVDYHVQSEVEPIYHGIILQSGTGYVEHLDGYNPIMPLQVAGTLGLNTTDVNEAVAYLATFDALAVVEATGSLRTFPCIEKEIDGVTRMVADNALNLKAPKVSQLKVMMGSMDDEMLVFFTGAPYETFPSEASVAIRNRLDIYFDMDTELLEAAEKMMRHFYIGDKDYTLDVMFDIADFMSDQRFIYPLERGLRRYLESGAEEIYYFFFSYSGGRNFNRYRRQLPPVRGAYHADELGYLFDMKFMTEEITPEDQLIIDRITLMWTNFAKFWDPTPETSDLLPVKWLPITQRDRVYHYINITTDINVGKRPFHRRMAFWDLFYEAYGQYEIGRASSTSNSASMLSTSSYLLCLLAFVVIYLLKVELI